MTGTRIQLHRDQQLLTTGAPDEPCLALIRNDMVFNLLVAQQVTDAGDTTSLHDVWWFCAQRDSSRIRRLNLITLAYEPKGIWSARNPATDQVIRRPSVVPYHLVFIDEHELRSINSELESSHAGSIFSTAQHHFGRLPGFDFGPGVLISPKNYATVTDLPEHDYLPE